MVFLGKHFWNENDNRLLLTLMEYTWTFIILFLIKDCRKTQTRRTNLFCIYLSFIVSQVDMQLDMYRCTNSVGKSTVVVSLFTTSIECRDISMLTSTLKYSVICLDCISLRRTSMAIKGLFSTRSGSWKDNTQKSYKCTLLFQLDYN